MSPTPLKTGQGLIAHSLGAALQRWLIYAVFVAITAATVSITSILHHVPAPSRELAGVYALARFKLLVVAAGLPLPPTVSLQTPNGPVLISAKIIARSPGFQEAARAVVLNATGGAMAGVLLGGVLSAIGASWAEQRGQVAALDRKLRGSALVSESVLARMTAKRASRSALYIASVPLPEDLETRTRMTRRPMTSMMTGRTSGMTPTTSELLP
jgi:hypothetical protein